jgi:medium-chain acyl-[acyl-carrier-protein] hydrolase
MRNELLIMQWIEFYKPNNKSKVRLFCFHHGGGGASAFYKWADKLPETIELGAVQLPGRENRFDEPLLQNMEEVIHGLLKNFDSYLGKPYIFFGHSMGAKISFELARALRNLNLPLPSHLVVSGCGAPHLPSDRPPIHALPDHEFISQLLIYNGIPPEIINNKEDLINLYLPIIKADFKILENYEFKIEEALPCNIVAIHGREDSTVEEENILEWKYHTAYNFRYFSTSGDHFFIKSAQNEVLNIIIQSLREAEENDKSTFKKI